MSFLSLVKWLNEDSMSETEVLLSQMRKFLDPSESTFPIPARRRPVVESCMEAEMRKGGC